MTKERKGQLEKAFNLLESEVDQEKVFAMFPEEKEEIQEIAFLMDCLEKEKRNIAAPKEVLEKILRKIELSNEEPGRFFVWETLNNLINNIKNMNQKLKLAIPALAIVALIAIGAISYNSNRAAQVATTQKADDVSEDLVTPTTSPVIGDKETDASINKAINDALSENNIDAEFDDIELALSSEEEELSQINNLFNDNEL